MSKVTNDFGKIQPVVKLPSNMRIPCDMFGKVSNVPIRDLNQREINEYLELYKEEVLRVFNSSLK